MKSTDDVAGGTQRKPTAIRVLDIAEDLFAERGYDATSLGEVADRVGIRQPSLYNHFRNKHELYVAVLERLLDPFLEMVDGIALVGSPPEKSEKLVGELMSYYGQHPNLLRLIQHAVLSGNEQIELLTERWFKPFLKKARVLDEHRGYDEDYAPFVVIAFNSMLMGYVTLAPLYGGIFGMELLAPENVQKQIHVLQGVVRSLQDLQPQLP